MSTFEKAVEIGRVMIYNSFGRTVFGETNMTFYAKKFSELSAGEIYEILKARADVFIIEQNINYQDMDDVDYDSLHCFLSDGGSVAAYLRAYGAGDGAVKLGRVLTRPHGRGLGRTLMERSIPAVAEATGCRRIVLDAQKYAVGFYEKFGFRVVSGEFLEEGIVHVAMAADI